MGSSCSSTATITADDSDEPRRPTSNNPKNKHQQKICCPNMNKSPNAARREEGKERRGANGDGGDVLEEETPFINILTTDSNETVRCCVHKNPLIADLHSSRAALSTSSAANIGRSPRLQRKSGGATLGGSVAGQWNSFSLNSSTTTASTTRGAELPEFTIGSNTTTALIPMHSDHRISFTESADGSSLGQLIAFPLHDQLRSQQESYPNHHHHRMSSTTLREEVFGSPSTTTGGTENDHHQQGDEETTSISNNNNSQPLTPSDSRRLLLQSNNNKALSHEEVEEEEEEGRCCASRTARKNAMHSTVSSFSYSRLTPICQH